MTRGSDDIEQRRSPLGRYLKALREERKLSQAKVARLSNGGISDGHIAQIEGGTRFPSGQMLQVIADVLDLTTEERQNVVRLRNDVVHNVTYEEHAALLRKAADDTTPAVTGEAAYAGLNIPDDLTPEERAALETTLAGIWARRTQR